MTLLTVSIVFFLWIVCSCTIFTCETWNSHLHTRKNKVWILWFRHRGNLIEQTSKPPQGKTNILNRRNNYIVSTRRRRVLSGCKSITLSLRSITKSICAPFSPFLVHEQTSLAIPDIPKAFFIWFIWCMQTCS